MSGPHPAPPPLHRPTPGPQGLHSTVRKEDGKQNKLVILACTQGSWGAGIGEELSTMCPIVLGFSEYIKVAMGHGWD
jgi:hypothetical protein